MSLVYSQPSQSCGVRSESEQKGAADYSLVAAEEGHGEDVIGSEVEYWGLGVEASNGSLGVDGQILLLSVSD
jgi:hypothetical protein